MSFWVERGSAGSARVRVQLSAFGGGRPPTLAVVDGSGFLVYAGCGWLAAQGGWFVFAPGRAESGADVLEYEIQ